MFLSCDKPFINLLQFSSCLALKSLFCEQVLQHVISGVEGFGFKCQGWIQSPITGAEGNVEFLACFHRLPPLPQ